jgi:hypothetical protein
MISPLYFYCHCYAGRADLPAIAAALDLTLPATLALARNGRWASRALKSMPAARTPAPKGRRPTSR